MSYKAVRETSGVARIPAPAIDVRQKTLTLTFRFDVSMYGKP